MLVLLSIASLAHAEWEVSSRELTWAGGTIQRAQVHYSGLPFDGAVPGTVKDRSDDERTHREWLPKEGPSSLAPVVSAEEALLVVEQGWKVTPINRGTLVVFPDEGKARLAWRFSVHALGGEWFVWVDAINGMVLSAQAESWTVDGWVYESGPLDGQLVDVNLPVVDSSTRLEGWNVWSSQCTDWTIDPSPFGVRVCHDWTQSAKANPQGDFYATPQEGSLRDPFAEVNAFYHSERIAQWFSGRFGLRLPPMQIFTGFPLTNAFYGDFNEDGDRDLSFGVTDDGFNFAYDGDVVMHEFGHAIVQELAGSLSMRADHLGIDWTPGALNEGVADTFAMVMQPDGLLAESMSRSSRWDGAIRDLHPDRRCPNDLASQVHRSGQIWGSMGWNLIEDPLVGVDGTAELMVAAVSTWDDSITWPAAAQSLIDASQQLLDEGWFDQRAHDAVVGHVEQTGALECERIVDMSETEESKLILLNLGLYADFERIPAGIQFKHPLGNDEHEIHLHVSNFSGPSEGTGLAVYARVDEPVEHEPTRIDGLGLAHAIPTIYDAVFEIDEESTTLVLDGSNVPGLRSGRVLHWSVATINRSRTPMDAVYLGLTVSANAHIQDKSKDPASSGCATVSMHQGNRAPFAWLVLLVLLVLRSPKRTDIT